MARIHLHGGLPRWRTFYKDPQFRLTIVNRCCLTSRRGKHQRRIVLVWSRWHRSVSPGVVHVCLSRGFSSSQHDNEVPHHDVWNVQIRSRCLIEIAFLTGKHLAENLTWRNDCKYCRHWTVIHHLCPTFSSVRFFQRSPSTQPLGSDLALCISHLLLHWETFFSRPRPRTSTLETARRRMIYFGTAISILLLAESDENRIGQTNKDIIHTVHMDVLDLTLFHFGDYPTTFQCSVEASVTIGGLGQFVFFFE